MSTPSPFPHLPKTNLTLPDTRLLTDALTHIKKYTSPTIVNYCLRSAYFAILLSRQLPSSPPLDMELVIFSTIMHDLGWATDKSLLSKDKRFEVDGANMARTYLDSRNNNSDWDKHRKQLMWDSIALHATPSFALHKETEVKSAHLGIMADFWGPAFRGLTITVEENQEIVDAFPRLGFKESFLGIMCGLCEFKPETTYDNFVGDYGVVFGVDGKGKGKEEFRKGREALSSPKVFFLAIGASEGEEA